MQWRVSNCLHTGSYQNILKCNINLVLCLFLWEITYF
jgi:hypothetical protein